MTCDVRRKRLCLAMETDVVRPKIYHNYLRSGAGIAFTDVGRVNGCMTALTASHMRVRPGAHILVCKLSCVSLSSYDWRSRCVVWTYGCFILVAGRGKEATRATSTVSNPGIGKSRCGESVLVLATYTRKKGPKLSRANARSNTIPMLVRHELSGKRQGRDARKRSLLNAVATCLRDLFLIVHLFQFSR